MELRINKFILDEALDRISKVIDPNPVFVTLKGIWIKAEDNKITMIGSNGAISIKHTISASMDVEITTPGFMLVEFNIFRNIIKKLEGDIVLKSDGKVVDVITDSDHFNINLYDEEYPAIDFDFSGEQLRIDWQDLKNLTKDVILATSNNENNLILNCVNISTNDGKIKFLATDRYRYAEATKDIDSDATFNISVLAKNLKDLLAFDFEGDVILNISDKKLSFEKDGSIIESKVVDQVYHDMSKIVPKEFTSEIIIEKRELNNLLNKASVIISENYNKLKIHILNDTMTFMSTRKEIANAEIKTQNFTYNGEELKIAINSRFLKDAISVFEGTLYIKFTKDKQRIVVVSDSNPNVIQLITPQKGF
ncbi:DNA polymerase III subunit beta [[Mycoplasma] falconis]|uniref:DNA polymerase III subunit beta n=1 Tax=[Mycoplasma] falconis TaxID=92403 RepID=A0A501X848_9BACT|nr:DNA polymerase III subunit beta [[Mycoplasma] falconis]TPE56711.1 DNA polymerase III subunit beta [[Mycoplasma] falconis]